MARKLDLCAIGATGALFSLGMLMLGSALQGVSANPTIATQSNNGEIELGRTLFERNCVVCHGIGGTGGRGPSLTRARLARAPDDIALRGLIETGIPPEMPEFDFFTEDDFVALVNYVRSLGKVAGEKLPGDAERGAAVFARSGCPGCHIVDGKGTGFGPDLTDVSERRSAAYVREAISNPRAKLPADFLMISAVTMKGEEVRGIRVNEDTFSIQIKDGRGTYHSLRKADLKQLERMNGETPMPSFEGVLTKPELQDVIAYLMAPRIEP